MEGFGIGLSALTLMIASLSVTAPAAANLITSTFSGSNPNGTIFVEFTFDTSLPPHPDELSGIFPYVQIRPEAFQSYRYDVRFQDPLYDFSYACGESSPHTPGVPSGSCSEAFSYTYEPYAGLFYSPLPDGSIDLDKSYQLRAAFDYLTFDPMQYVNLTQDSIYAAHHIYDDGSGRSFSNYLSVDNEFRRSYCSNEVLPCHIEVSLPGTLPLVAIGALAMGFRRRRPVKGNG